MARACSIGASVVITLTAIYGAVAQSSVDFFASGGGIDSTSPCAFAPWTYTNADGVSQVMADPCVDINEFPPLTQPEFTSTDPSNTDTSKWCPIVQDYSTASGSSWGFCVSIQLGDQDGRPTASPVAGLNGTESPSTAGTSFNTSSPTVVTGDATLAPSTEGAPGLNDTETTDTPTTQTNETTSSPTPVDTGVGSTVAPTLQETNETTASPTLAEQNVTLTSTPTISETNEQNTSAPVGAPTPSEGVNETSTSSPTVDNSTLTPPPSSGGDITPSPSTSPISNSSQSTQAPSLVNVSTPTVSENTSTPAPSSVANETETSSPTPFTNGTGTEPPSQGGNETTFSPTPLGNETNATTSPGAAPVFSPTGLPTPSPTFNALWPTGEAAMFPFATGQGITGVLKVTTLPTHLVITGTLEGLPPNCMHCSIGVFSGFSCNDEEGFDSPGELISAPAGLASFPNDLGSLLNFSRSPIGDVELVPIMSDGSGQATVSINLATEFLMSIFGRTILVYVPSMTNEPTASPTFLSTARPTPGGGGGENVTSNTSTPTMSPGGNNVTLAPSTVGDESNATSVPSVPSNGTGVPTVSNDGSNATLTPTVSSNNVTISLPPSASTDSPTPGNSTAAPTTGSGQVVAFASAGWMEQDTPCAFAPWTFIDVDGSVTTVNSSCVPFSVLEPYMGGNQAPQQPDDPDADTDLWCSTLKTYMKDPPAGQRLERKQWGYCLEKRVDFGRRVLQSNSSSKANVSSTPAACGKILPKTGPAGVPATFAEILPVGYPDPEPVMSLDLEDGHVTYVPGIQLVWDLGDTLGDGSGGSDGSGGGEAGGNSTVPTNKTDGGTNTTEIEGENNTTITVNETDAKPNATVPLNTTIPGRNDTDVSPGGGSDGSQNETKPSNETIPIDETGTERNDTVSPNMTAPGGEAVPPSNNTNSGNESLIGRLLQSSGFELIFLEGSCSNGTEYARLFADSVSGTEDNTAILQQLKGFAGGSLRVESVANRSNQVCNSLDVAPIPRGTMVVYELFLQTIVSLAGTGFQPGTIAVDSPCGEGVPLNVSEDGVLNVQVVLDQQLFGEPEICITSEDDVAVATGILNSQSVENSGPTTSPSSSPVVSAPTAPTAPTMPTISSAPTTGTPTASPVNGTVTTEPPSNPDDMALALGLAFGLGIPFLLAVALVIRRKSRSGGGGGTPEYTSSNGSGSAKKGGSFSRMFGGSNLSTQNGQ